MHSHPRTMQRLALVRAGANGGDRTAGKWQWTGGEREGVYVTRVKCPECSETGRYHCNAPDDFFCASCNFEPDEPGSCRLRPASSSAENDGQQRPI
jgi:hypothetical protein